MSLRASIIFFLVCGTGCLPAQQYLTVVTSLSINHVPVPEQFWTSLAVDSLDVIEVNFLCREGSGITNTAGVRYQIDLNNGSQHYSNSQYETSKVFINLPKGVYSLSVQGQSPTQEWSAVPYSLRFTVDPVQAAKFKSNFLSSTTAAPFSFWREPVFIWSSSLVLAALIVFFVIRRQSQIIRDAQGMNVGPRQNSNGFASDTHLVLEQKSQEAKRAKMLEDEIRSLRKENEGLSKKVEDLHKKSDELNLQNRDLEGQVDRVSNVKRELEDLQRQKDDLFAVIVHDIKNPASLVKNLVDLLRGYDLNSGETREVMQDIIETTTKIVSLSQELSRVMAMEYSEVRLLSEESDAGHIIESVCRRNMASARKKNIDISFDVPADLPTCEIDPEKIEEVMDNLISNAIKFSLPETSIHVRVIPSAETFAIEVEDRGLGMSKEDMAKAFQRGVKLSARPTGDEPSSGLGLWIVKRLVEAHSGTVSIRSELGRGSTFVVKLPYKQPVLFD